MAIRNTYTKPGLVEPGPRARSASALQVFDVDRVEGADHLLDETVTSAPRPLTAEVLPPAPEGTAPLRPVDQISPPVLDAPRPVSAGNDTASAVEDGPAVVISVLNNDVGAAAVAVGQPVWQAMKILE